jgi:hypothetical protein
MRARILGCALFLIFLLALWLPCGAPFPGSTRLELTEVGTGRKIFSADLQDGEQVVLTWNNSLFGLVVTEVFESQKGTLVLTEVSFAAPHQSTPPAVSSLDLEDLYQTGGPFCAKGLAKPFRQVVYRVAEIGEPKMKIRDQVVDFKKEVGFGGGIILTAGRSVSLFDRK